MLSAKLVRKVDCPSCSFAIWLPHRSPLGTDDGQWYLPTDAWPLTLLCIPRGRLCSCEANTHQKSELLTDQAIAMGCLWAIGCKCDHDNCGSLQTIYAHGSASETEESVLSALLSAIPSTHCEAGHTFQIADGKVKAARFPL